jgi:hypothetical protein
MRLMVLALLFTVGGLLNDRASAHGWYEWECCTEKDCRPVADGYVVERVDGVYVKNWGLLHRTDRRLRPSRDEQDHVCERIAPGGRSALLCVYLRQRIM